MGTQLSTTTTFLFKKNGTMNQKYSCIYIYWNALHTHCHYSILHQIQNGGLNLIMLPQFFSLNNFTRAQRQLISNSNPQPFQAYHVILLTLLTCSPYHFMTHLSHYWWQLIFHWRVIKIREEGQMEREWIYEGCIYLLCNVM